MHAADLSALRQVHVPERSALGRTQHVVEEGEVRRRVLERLLPVSRTGAVEQVRGVAVPAERLPALAGVREVRQNVLNAGNRALRRIA